MDINFITKYPLRSVTLHSTRRVKRRGWSHQGIKILYKATLIKQYLLFPYALLIKLESVLHLFMQVLS